MNRVRGISIAVIALLGVGAIGGAVAWGVTTSTPAASGGSPATAVSPRPTPSATSPAPVTQGATPAPAPAPVPAPAPAPDPVIDPGPAPEPDPVEAPRDTILGYDARQLWDECSAKGIEAFPGSEVIVDYDLRYFHQQPDGRAAVYVAWGKPAEPDLTHVIWICVFSGDTSAPVLDILQPKDI